MARNRSRKPGRPSGRGFDSFTFLQFSRVPLLLPVCKTGVYETGRSADERFESSGAHQFQESGISKSVIGIFRGLTLITRFLTGGRGLTAESLSATQGVWVRFPPSAPILQTSLGS